MSAKHTPGPCRAERNIIRPQGYELNNSNPTTAEADARLYAAAPELLSELKLALYMLETGDSGYGTESLKAAIAKAEGRES